MLQNIQNIKKRTCNLRILKVEQYESFIPLVLSVTKEMTGACSILSQLKRSQLVPDKRIKELKWTFMWNSAFPTWKILLNAETDSENIGKKRVKITIKITFFHTLNVLIFAIPEFFWKQIFREY